MAITEMHKAFGTAALCAAIGVGAAIFAGGTITLVAPARRRRRRPMHRKRGSLAENAM